MNSEGGDDLEFLVQLAKEFPPLENRPQRTTSFSLSPKLLTPERDLRTSAMLNRKLSLPLNCMESRRNSLHKEPAEIGKSSDSTRGSIAESDTTMGNETDFSKEHRNSGNSDKLKNENSKYRYRRYKPDLETSNSPPIGSVSSAEDESGFSSMNSFQDVGLPTVNSTVCEEVSAKEALLRSMLHSTPINNGDLSESPMRAADAANLYRPQENGEKSDKYSNLDEIKLWHKVGNHIFHQRRNSSPAAATKEKTSMKVLWV